MVVAAEETVDEVFCGEVDVEVPALINARVRGPKNPVVGNP